MLGAYIGITECVAKEVIIKGIEKSLGAKRPDLLSSNIECFERGYKIGQEAK